MPGGWNAKNNDYTKNFMLHNEISHLHFSHLLLKENSRIKVMEGAKHNLPDADAQKAAAEIKQLASKLTEKDLLLVLISGKNASLPLLYDSPLEM